MSNAYQDVIIAGFGGQGVMLIGNLLAQAGMEHGLEVSFIPVYGAEMRGGTANCTVVLDEHPIGSPLVREPMSTIILNEPSLSKFQPRLSADGVQIVNASLVAENLLDAAKRTVYIPVNDMAHELGNVKMANMVALGAWLKANGEAIYSTRAYAPYDLGGFAYTQRASEGKVYAMYHMDEGEKLGRTLVIPFNQEAKRVTLLDCGGCVQVRRADRRRVCGGGHYARHRGHFAVPAKRHLPDSAHLPH